MFLADPLLLKSPVPQEKKQFLGSVSVFCTRNKTKKAKNWPEIDTLFSPFFEDIQMRVSDPKLDISTNGEPKSDIYISKSKFRY